MEIVFSSDHISAISALCCLIILTVINSAAGNILVGLLYNSSKIFPVIQGLPTQEPLSLVLIKVLWEHIHAHVYVLTGFIHAQMAEQSCEDT